jgi:deoxyribonuclease-4
MSVLVGAHVEQSQVVEAARATGAEVVQVFLGDPQSYHGPEITFPGGAAALRAALEDAGIPVYVHAPYIINVASTNNRIRIPSRKLLQQHVDLAAQIGARGIVVHGGHVTAKDDLEVGFDNWRKAVQATDLKVPVLIENTAGGEKSVARTLERIASLWEAIGVADGADRIGFCLDTCHAHAAGIDLLTAVESLRQITGRIDLVHLNDSRDEPGSGADRHASLGAGLAAPDGLAAVVRDADTATVLETPGGPDDRKADIAWVRARL